MGVRGARGGQVVGSFGTRRAAAAAAATESGSAARGTGGLVVE